MFSLFWRAIKSLPAIAVSSLLIANASFAQEKSKTNSLSKSLQQIDQNQNSGNNSLYKVTNPGQVDISLANLVYEDLLSLVDRYGCITNFPNQYYHTNQALSRNEFATDLNSCLNQIEGLAAYSEATIEEDIDTISLLTQEFEIELATISDYVDYSENLTAIHKEKNLSTNKLNDKSSLAIADVSGANQSIDSRSTEITFRNHNNAWMNYGSRFIGEDRLLNRLSLGDISEYGRSNITTINVTHLGLDASDGKNHEIKARYYHFPFFDESVTGYVGNANLGVQDLFNVNNPILASKRTASVSSFIRSNPILFRGTDGIGAGLSTDVGMAKITGMYLTNEGAKNPSNGEGIFSSSYSTGAQIGISPSSDLDISLTYVYEYLTGVGVDLTGDIGSDLAKRPFGKAETRTHQVGLGANYSLGDKVVFSATSGLSLASEIETKNNATLYTAAVTASIMDVGKEDAVFSLAGGIPPILMNNDKGEDDKDMSFLIEAQYKYPVSKNMTITPGAFVVINPEGNSDNGTEVVGVLRTTLRF